VQFVVLSVRHAIPAMYAAREYPEAGGLMSYGTDALDEWHQVGIDTGQILKGGKPADLPVVQSSKLELVTRPQVPADVGGQAPLLAAPRAATQPPRRRAA
jgi:putative ABC transport system substrate-binding protein